MKRILSVFVLSLVVFPVARGLSQESLDMQVEFIRRLRAKGYNDLALEQIDKLKSDAAVSAALALERARTTLALALEKRGDQRQPLLAAARAQLEAFVKTHPAGWEGAQARLDIARLAADEGQTLLTRALREEDTALAKSAEQQFIQAGDALEQAIAVLAGPAVSYTNPDPTSERRIKQQLAQDLAQARFDRAGNYFDQARSYINLFKDADNNKRAELVVQAKKAFEPIAEGSGPIGFLASAWLVKINQEGGAADQAEKYRKRVMADTSKAAQPAQRLARAFYIQGIMKNPTIKLDPAKKNKLIVDEGKKWLAAYPTFQNSPEGLTVRFELAKALVSEAQALAKDTSAPPVPAAVGLLSQAQKHFLAIAESDSYLANKAKGFNVDISILQMGEKTVLADLKDFDKCYLRAQLEMSRLKKVVEEIAAAPPKDRDKLEPQRKGHLQEVLKALSRAIMLADAKTSPQDLDEARFLLATGFMESGDMQRAAVAGEALGRVRPPSKHSAQAAGHAIAAYANVLQRDNDDSNRQRLKDLAGFVLSPEGQKTWAAEPVTSVARYQLAMLCNKDNDYPGAITQLEKIAPDFRGFVYAQGQLVFIALEARDKAQADAAKKAFAATARRAILRIANLPGDADANTATLYFYAQLELPKFYYADAALALEKKDLTQAERLYNEMGKLVTALKAKLDKTTIKLSPETRAKLEFSMAVMGKYPHLGLAELDYRKGNYDKVLKTTEDVVAGVAKRNGDGKSPIPLKDYQVTGDILGLALRANVQKGNTAKAGQILGYLERVTGEDGGGVAEASHVLRSLIGDLQTQIKELKKTNDPAKLKATVTNFSAFIDKLAAQKDKGLELKDMMFLATCYSSLDEYGKAADLYAKIPEPKILVKDKLTEEEEKELATYWFLQVQYARALRLSATNKEDLSRAKKVLDAMQRHKNVRLQVYGEVEQIHVLEDSGNFGTPLYGLAIKGWAALMSNPSLRAKIADDPNLKELYFNAYYGNAWCLYKLSQTDKVIAAGQEMKYLQAAAKSFLKLEASANQEGWQIVGHRVRDLLGNEKKLKDEYEKLKSAAK